MVRAACRFLHCDCRHRAKHLLKAGTKRYWKRFVELLIEPLDSKSSAALLEDLIAQYEITADDSEAYRKRVLACAQGSPYELQRLTKQHSGKTVVRVSAIAKESRKFGR
ncbi:hypothetical protein [Rubritalea tangerina]|uniref:hypothetical protein n=1 Tax=Rubritalea tangerina TaxID=430798 RepID=UPI003616791D